MNYFGTKRKKKVQIESKHLHSDVNQDLKYWNTKGLADAYTGLESFMTWDLSKFLFSCRCFCNFYLQNKLCRPRIFCACELGCYVMKNLWIEAGVCTSCFKRCPFLLKMQQTSLDPWERWRESFSRNNRCNMYIWSVMSANAESQEKQITMSLCSLNFKLAMQVNREWLCQIVMFLCLAALLSQHGGYHSMPSEPGSCVWQRWKHLPQRVYPLCGETVSTHSCSTLMTFTHQFNNTHTECRKRLTDWVLTDITTCKEWQLL